MQFIASKPSEHCDHGECTTLRTDGRALRSADRSGSPLEVGVVAEGKRFKIIHAMPARAKYLR